MGRTKRKAQRKAAEAQTATGTGQEPEESIAAATPYNASAPEPAKALVAVNGMLVAAAAGSDLRVYDRRIGAAVNLPESSHDQPIRALAFDSSGAYLLAGGDDKCLRVWDCQHWRLVLKTHAAKRISAAAFSADCRYVLFADKFGDVQVCAMPNSDSLVALLAAPTADATIAAEPPAAASSQGGEQPATSTCEGRTSVSEEGAAVTGKAEFLLGHFCSIVTSLTPSPDGRLLVSTDRDKKARVSLFPKDPLQGAHTIQSFCQGHTAFVTCSAFLIHQGQLLLVTGSGDGTVKLWEPEEGKLLSTFETSPLTCKPEIESLHLHSQPTFPAETSSTPTSEEPALSSIQHGNVEADQPASAANPSEDEADGGGDREPQEEGIYEDLPPAVLGMSVSPDGNSLAVAVEGHEAILVMTVADSHLRLCQQLLCAAVPHLTCVAFNTDGLLWVVGSGQDHPFTIGAAVRVEDAQRFKEAGEEVVTDALKNALGVGIASKANGSEHPGKSTLQASQQLRKRMYTQAEMQGRKKNRRDLRMPVDG